MCFNLAISLLQPLLVCSRVTFRQVSQYSVHTVSIGFHMMLGYHTYRLSQLKDLLSGCFERVDMDLVFFEDSQQGQRSEVTSRHTVAYLLTWLLVIRAMSRCGPEVSGCQWI